MVEMKMMTMPPFHLRSASVNNAAWSDDSESLYNSPELDFVSYHTYDAHGRVGVNPFQGAIYGTGRINPVKAVEYFLKRLAAPGNAPTLSRMKSSGRFSALKILDSSPMAQEE